MSNIYFNFDLLLTSAVFISGVIVLLDYVSLASKRGSAQALPAWIEYARSFFPVLLIVLLFRSFLFEPFRIPSGSLKPTLLVGDFVLTNKFSYGIRLPISHKKIISLGEPKRGDIVVFRFPHESRQNENLIKRIVGVPGDKLSYLNKVLYINGKPMEQNLLGYVTQKDEKTLLLNRVFHKQENLSGVKHDIYQYMDNSAQDFEDIVVPPGQYFAMGDNRDASADSRAWGFVPDSVIIGKAILVWFSWDHDKWSIRWKRMGQKINSL